MVVQHRYEPTDASKFLRQRRTACEKNNWSRVMLFNEARWRHLSPGYAGHGARSRSVRLSPQASPGDRGSALAALARTLRAESSGGYG